MNDITEFVKHYKIAALWSSTDDSGNHLDKNFNLDNFAPETNATIRQDCEKFITDNETILSSIQNSPDHIAHDFWLTRNGHGAGFWDGDYAEPYATLLTEYCAKLGGSDLYVGDDNQLYIM
ncbi:hypothetical protein KAR91_51710 [Candidatus Pacearchaeota archaeon]|nr:hypothetical protein [Candidatus Pacearchaeota archaeon]